MKKSSALSQSFHLLLTLVLPFCAAHTSKVEILKMKVIGSLKQSSPLRRGGNSAHAEYTYMSTSGLSLLVIFRISDIRYKKLTGLYHRHRKLLFN